MRQPERAEYKKWLTNEVTQWFMSDLLEQFNSMKTLRGAETQERLFEIKGEQAVIYHILTLADTLEISEDD